jgi:uncharacterized protein (TIGR02996 family)
VDNPGDDSLYDVLADWLEENDDPRRAELLRLHRRLLATCCEPEKPPEGVAWQARLVELLAEGVRPCVPRRTVELGEGVETAFVWVPPGAFLMGSPESEEGRGADEGRRRVTLTRGLWIGATPLTQAQWSAVMGGNPSHFRRDDLPVESVTWEECLAFCARLGEKVGGRCRLPTEAEWERACRAGTTTAYHGGDGLESLKKVGWCSYDNRWRSAGRTRPVAELLPNTWGLSDLHGNVFEWCADRYTPALPAVHRREYRVLRGGCWCGYPTHCRSAARTPGALGHRHFSIGCRVVLDPG